METKLPKRVRVEKCMYPTWWYTEYIHREFEVLGEVSEDWKVKVEESIDKDGYCYLLKVDCTPIYEEEEAKEEKWPEVVLELPEGDNRKIKTWWRDVKEGRIRLCVSIEEEKTQESEPTPNHYARKCLCGLKLDPYRISEIYELNSMAHHIVKKGLCAGNRGHKELRHDLEDIIKTARRWLEMLDEEEKDHPPTP